MFLIFPYNFLYHSLGGSLVNNRGSIVNILINSEAALAAQAVIIGLIILLITRPVVQGSMLRL